ncbi:MAG: RNA polymerase sigma factor SigJ [Gammaproteobacteria bacterium]|nr:RNA polymerase sigma factor SigJ [Gammaproteobacteria bacterium]
MTEPLASTDFERHRRHLLRLAYRILGSVSEAEDVVQEAWLRWSGSRLDAIADARAWLTTTTTRLAIDALRAAQRQRVDYVGPWLPEPLVEDAGADPAAVQEMADEVSIALLLALERLAPEERAAFLLREVFDIDYGEIAATLERSEPACRQMVKRARQRVAADRPRFDVPAEEHAQLVRTFAAAVAGHGSERLSELFAPDVELWSDGGGKVAAMRKPLFGRERVLKALAGLARVQVGRLRVEERDVNGRLGLLLIAPDGMHTLVAMKVRNGSIHGLYLIRNPAKLPAGKSEVAAER